MLALNRRLIAAAMVAAAVLTSGCEPAEEGEIRVAVIGEEPRVADPTDKRLSPADQILVANVAQGLVRFDPRGQIVPGLAERWNVSDDGMSYIFRLASAEWPDGTKVTAHQVARMLRRARGPARSPGLNPLSDSLGAVAEIVSMTDRVLELRLNAPRPNLLQLLAQPELALVRPPTGTGPFELKEQRGKNGELRLVREVPQPDGEEMVKEEVWLTGAPAPQAVTAFRQEKLDLVLGGTFVDLPFVHAARLQRGALVFDPVAGLFGLVPARTEGPLADPQVRQLLSQALDREAFLAAIQVPGLLPRSTILQGGLEGMASVQPPQWTATPIADRRSALIAESDRLFGVDEKPELKIALPEGPGADILFRRLELDWGLLGLKLLRVKSGASADLRLIDAVAPSTSPAWFLRQFRCKATPICVEEAEDLLQSAREALVPLQRTAFLMEAALLMEEGQLFIPIAAPVRWSLVSPRVLGFAGNRFARHTLTGLRQSVERTASE
jgi:peptide/nickel transport system substrate-binding protein